MTAEVVHDDDVARLEERNELLFDIGTEAFAVDRTVKDAGGHELIAAQGSEEGQCPPVSMRREATHAHALRSPAAQWGHAGLDPRLVDEDQTRRIKVELPRAPAPSPARDVGAGLLKGEQSFF